MRRKFVRVLLIVLAGILIAVPVFIIYLRAVAIAHPPIVDASPHDQLERTEVSPGFYTLGNSWLRRSDTGLYELYVEGKPYELGLINGKLTRELVQHQETVFNEQINSIVPSSSYRYFLKYFVGWFNRDLDEHVIEEYKQEIYGVSHAASHDYDHIASPYQRILNYHAAHDIGHALQNMALVGCTSFAVWAERSSDTTLTIGRNFDFFVGDEFAEDKVIAFYSPFGGHKFMMVTWGGMTGVLSGMNDAGLTVTINAAKSDMPFASATPVSLVAREILEYATTIDEAYAIAGKRKMFVSESFLIGSANDRRAAIIEKSPDDMALVESATHQIISTNHYQSEKLGNTALNKKHMQTSASPYRFQRVEELMNRSKQLSVTDFADILRNQAGRNDRDIGRGNEKSINQLVAHHSIIFQPEKMLVWVSTSPWQLGKYVCYNLDSVFRNRMTDSHELYDSAKTIQADPFLNTKSYTNFTKFAHYRFPFEPHIGMNPDSLIRWNPNSYHAYMLAGDYYYNLQNYSSALKAYEQGLTKEVATEQERIHMQENLEKSKQQLK